MATRQGVAQFLNEFGAAITLGFEKWLPRSEDRQHLIDLNLTQNQALEVIKQLTPENYSKGPEPDDTRPERSIWVFGADINGVEAYIKLALQEHPPKSIVYGLIWSFHKADFPMTYPLRQS